MTVDEMIAETAKLIEDKKDFYSCFGHFSMKLDHGEILDHLVTFRAALEVAMNELNYLTRLGVICETGKEADSGN